MVLIWILLGVVAFTLGMKLFFYSKAKRRNAVSKKLRLELGGKPQKVLIEGKADTLPLLVMLHGGPGVAFPFGGCCRGALPQLTEYFLTVYWDQYGCGNNYTKLPPDLAIADYDAMLKDLIDHLAAAWPNNKIYVFGLSWGSLLVARAASTMPDKLAGAIAYGQVLSFAENNAVAMKALEGCALTEAHSAQLEEAKAMGSVEAKDVLDELIDKYTNGSSYKGKDASNGFFLKLWPILFSPDYSLLYHLRAQTGYLNIKNNTQVLQELAAVDIRDELAGVRVPYHILQGRHDLTTATPLVEEFISAAGNGLIDLEIFEKSSHMPSGEDMERVLARLKELAV